MGGPSKGRDYKVAIEDRRRVDSKGTRSKTLLGTLETKDLREVRSVAQRIPAQQCQTYVACVVFELEEAGLLERGIAERLWGQARMSLYAQPYLNGEGRY